MRNFVLLWGQAVFFFESAVKTCIIPEAVLPEYLRNNRVLAECLSTHFKPSFCDILVDGDPKVLFKALEDLRTADIKCSGKLIDRQILIQMVFNILDKTTV